MSKTLKITFSGICTLAPGYPEFGKKGPDTVYVLMPAARQPDKTKDGIVYARHRPFISIPRKNLVSGPGRIPDLAVNDERAGLCDIFLFDRRQVTVTPAPAANGQNALEYFQTQLPVKGVPGKPDVAPRNDIRWLADIRTFWPGKGRLNPLADPAQVTAPDRAAVAGVAKFTQGKIEANFPCPSPGKQAFHPPAEKANVTQEVFASEFTFTVEYDDNTSGVDLTLSPLDAGAAADMNIPLQWNGGNVLNVRIGNDSLDEIVATARKRCPLPTVFDVPKTTDNDFVLHYNLLANIPEQQRPLPIKKGGESAYNGCIPMVAGG